MNPQWLTPKRWIIIGLLVMLMVPALASIQAQADDTPGAKIIFMSRRDGRAEIYSMNPDGSDQRRLTVNEVNDNEPAPSPNGRWIAFTQRATSRGEIWIMDADGSNLRNLTTDDSHDDYSPTWSPDSRSIAFAKGNQIFVMNADGSNQRPLLSQTFSRLTGLAWSPDGAQLIFSAFHTELRKDQLYLINSDGTNVRYLNPMAEAGWDLREPKWSWDSRQIVFRGQHFDQNMNAIFVSNVDGSGAHAIFGPDKTNRWKPSWTPSGFILVSIKNETGFDIYRVNADGSNPVQLTTARNETFVDREEDGEPMWMLPSSNEVVEGTGSDSDTGGPDRIFLVDDFSDASSTAWTTNEGIEGTWQIVDGHYVIELASPASGFFRGVEVTPASGNPRLADSNRAVEFVIDFQVLEHSPGEYEYIAFFLNYGTSRNDRPEVFLIFADGTWVSSRAVRLRSYERVAQGNLPDGLNVFDGNPHRLILWISNDSHRLLVDGTEVARHLSTGINGTVAFAAGVAGAGSSLKVAFDNVAVQSPFLALEILGDVALSEAQGSPDPNTTVFADPAVFPADFTINLTNLADVNMGTGVALWRTSFSPDGRFFAYLAEPIGGPPMLVVSDLQSGTETQIRFDEYTYRPEDYESEINKSPSFAWIYGTDLALVSYLCLDCAYTVRVVNLTTGQTVQTFNLGSPIYGLVVSPDGRWMTDGVTVWDISAGFPGVEVPTSLLHYFYAVLPDGRSLAISGETQVFAVGPNLNETELVYNSDLPIYSIRTVANRRQAVLLLCPRGGINCRLRFVDTTTWEPSAEFYLGDNDSIAISPDGAFIAVRYRDQPGFSYVEGVRLYRIADGQELGSMRTTGLGDLVSTMAFHPSGRILMARYSSLNCNPLCEPILQLWRIE